MNKQQLYQQLDKLLGERIIYKNDTIQIIGYLKLIQIKKDVVKATIESTEGYHQIHINNYGTIQTYQEHKTVNK